MSLLDHLRRAGERIGILHAERAPGGAVVKLVPREITIADLCAGPAAPVPPSWPDPDAVFAGGGIPGMVWTAPRAADVLAGEFAGLDHERAQSALLARLAGDGASSEDVVRDALARDQALDAAADATLASLRNRAAARRAEHHAIASQIAALTAKRDALARDEAADVARWQAWWARKQALEQRLALAVRPLVDRPVVSLAAETPLI